MDAIANSLVALSQLVIDHGEITDIGQGPQVSRHDVVLISLH
jgi:hypothetical protein